MLKIAAEAPGVRRAPKSGPIQDIRFNPDEVRPRPWNPKGGGKDYVVYRKGNVVVVTKADGEFVTIRKGGGTPTAGIRSNCKVNVADPAVILQLQVS